MKLRPFELALVVVFLVLIVLSLVFLSSYKASNDDDVPTIGSVTIWGTVPQAGMDRVLDDLRQTNGEYRGVSYRSIPAESFENELINALADGAGPDVIFASHEHLVSLRSKIQPISYESFPLRDVQSAYIDGASVFALADGLYGYPIMADPLMLFWNKNILATDNFLAPPPTWEALVNDYLPTLIRRSFDRSIERSVVALGEYHNVRNAFGVLSMLMHQAGTRGVVSETERTYSIRINQSVDGTTEPLRVAADFYTRFSRPSNALYSWNRSFSSDKDRFLSENLALYFGYGSEARDLERQNPNLSFDIAEVPQGAAATVRRTYARFYGLSILRASANKPGAAIVLRDLGTESVTQKIAQLYDMVPAFRSSVTVGSNDTYGRITYKSAIIAFGWLNPEISAINQIFTTMTQDLNENRRDLTGATTDALGRLEIEYN